MNSHMAIYRDHYFELMWRRKFTPDDEAAEDRLLTELDRCWYKMSDAEIREVEDFLNRVETLKSGISPNAFNY